MQGYITKLLTLYWKLLLGFFLAVVVAAGLVVAGLFPGRSVPVLMYHHITDQKGSNALEVSRHTLEMQMSYLKNNGYRVVDPKELGLIKKGQERLRKQVVLTFDDGYQDNYDNALPVVEKNGFKATFFVVTDWVGKPGFMGWEELRDVQRRGHTVGSHSVSHPFLTEIPLAKAKDEIYTSNHLLEENLANPILFFCYPAGRFNSAVVSMVRGAGYEAAFTNAPGWAFGNRDLFALKRIRVSESSDRPWKFWWRVSGYYLLFRERSARRMRCWS